MPSSKRALVLRYTDWVQKIHLKMTRRWAKFSVIFHTGREESPCQHALLDTWYAMSSLEQLGGWNQQGIWVPSYKSDPFWQHQDVLISCPQKNKNLVLLIEHLSPHSAHRGCTTVQSRLRNYMMRDWWWLFLLPGLLMRRVYSFVQITTSPSTCHSVVCKL